MIVSMAAFATADTLVKISTSSMSAPQVLLFLMSGGLIIFALITFLQKDRFIDKRAFSPILLLRYAAEVVGMAGMVMALANVPISSVGAITQASPMLVTVGAVFFLNEKVGWRRWCSIIIGFIGVLLIVQPGAIEFDFAILWAILAVVALSVRDLTTRMVPTDMPSASLATYTMIAAIPFAMTWVALSGNHFLPAYINWFVIVPMVVIGAAGYMLLIISLRMAAVSVVMPFRYTRIVFLLITGIVVFGEKPNTLMLIGASLIVISGTYMMWRDHLVKQKKAQE